MVRASSFFNWGLLVIACIFAMVIATLGKGFWLLLATVSLGSGPMPKADTLELLLFVSFLISTGLFWKFPWLAALIAWVDLAITLSGSIPWVDHSFNTFIIQFMFDHIFFVAANLGLVGFLLMKRRSRAETA